MTEAVAASFARIAAETTAKHADGDDRDARFPQETVDALRTEGLLSLPVPVALGGRGLHPVEVGRLIGTIAAEDPSLGVILCMHYSQVEVLARHGRTQALQDLLCEIHERQLLIANVNSEIAIAGTQRVSGCFVERGPDGFRLEKQTPVISYGGYADAYVVTARRDEDAAPGDQVIAVCRAADVELTPLGPWDALGLRATLSRPFRLTARGPLDLVVDEPYNAIVSATGLPITHVMFAQFWLAIAERAADVAHRYVRKRSRGEDTASGVRLLRLAELAGRLAQLRALVAAATDRLAADYGTAATEHLGFVQQMLTLKVTASQLLVDIVFGSLSLVGIAAYRNDTEQTLGRLLRDAIGCTMMVNNDGVLLQTGELLGVRKEL